MDVARTVARRAERALATVSVKFGADNGAKKYMNRLADYLYILARYTDAKMEEMSAEEVDKPTEKHRTVEKMSQNHAREPESDRSSQ